MRQPSDYSSLLEELHHDEQVIRADEQRLKLTITLLIGFVMIFTGASFYLAHVIRTLERPETKSQIVNPIQSPTSVTPIATQPTTSISVQSTLSSPKVIKNPNTTNAYINIGFGTNQSSDWTDVFGATSTADIGEYKNIKEVRFEAFVNVPITNGTVSVRLYNKTDKHPVWNSEVTHEGTVDTYHFISPIISYDTGPKLYQVQMKSQLGIVANLVQSRIAIVTQ